MAETSILEKQSAEQSCGSAITIFPGKIGHVTAPNPKEIEQAREDAKRIYPNDEKAQYD